MNSQVITRGGSQASTKGPAEYFTGDVRVQPLFAPEDAAAYGGAYVTFQPGARSAWHIHPAGQRLIVTDGVGRTQQSGGPVEEIRAGDVLWCPPGVKHWHGASPTSAMTHLALTGVRDGQSVEWLEKVSDQQYGADAEHEDGGLTTRQQAVATIAAFTAGGDLPRLERALSHGLDAGLTVNAALANLVGVNSQLEAHLTIGFNTGLTEANMKGLVAVLRSEVGHKQADNASEVLSKVLSSRHD